MRDRQLTGPWAGFSFRNNRLVTPEGHELLPEDLAWLALTAVQAQEWRRLMEARRHGQPMKPRPFTTPNVIDLATSISRPKRLPTAGERLRALKRSLSTDSGT